MNLTSGKLLRSAPDAQSGVNGGTTDPVTTPAPVGPDLSFIPADYHTDGAPDPSKFSAHYTEAMAELAALKGAKAVPENYKFALPDGFKIEGAPEGFDPGLDVESPAFKPLFEELGGFLKGVGAPETAGKDVMGLLAKYEAAKVAQVEADAVKYHEAEVAKLGPTAPARLDTVKRALETKLPAEQVAAILPLTRNAAAFMALEKLLSAQGVPSAAPVPPSTENLSPYERLQRANAAAPLTRRRA